MKPSEKTAGSEKPLVKTEWAKTVNEWLCSLHIYAVNYGTRKEYLQS